MTIRISAGTAPRLGRMTLPQGTYLSNPATASAGPLGGPAGMNPPEPPGRGRFEQAVPMGFLDAVRELFASNTPYRAPIAPDFQPQPFDPNVNASGRGPRPGGPTADARTLRWVNQIRAILGVKLEDEPDFQAMGVPFVTPYTFKQINDETDNTTLVGFDIGANPAVVSLSQARSIFPYSADASEWMMRQRGYVLVTEPGKIPYYVLQRHPGYAPNDNARANATQGGIVQQQQNNMVMGPKDDRGYAEWVDPTMLERGERVTTSDGFTYVGGTPTAEGNAQFAVTYPGGVDDDSFKWETNVRQLEDGSWMRTYKRVLRASQTRSHRRKQQARAEQAALEQGLAVEAAARQKSAGVDLPVTYNQLVNLRTDFG